MTAVRWVVEHPPLPSSDWEAVHGARPADWVEYRDESTARAHAGTAATVWALVTPEVVRVLEAAVAVGPCMDRLDGFGGAVALCELPHGHAGGHREGLTTWTPATTGTAGSVDAGPADWPTSQSERPNGEYRITCGVHGELQQRYAHHEVGYNAALRKAGVHRSRCLGTVGVEFVPAGATNATTEAP